MNDTGINAVAVWTVTGSLLLGAYTIWAFAIPALYGNTDPTNYLIQIEDIVEEIHEHHRDGISTEEWANFQEDALDRLADIQHDLHEEVGDGRQTTTDLIKLCRDIVPLMVRSGTKNNPSLNERFQFYVQVIKRNIDKEAARNETQFMSVGERITLLVDGILVLAIGRAYLMRRSI